MLKERFIMKALVTGASSGIGRDIARVLYKKGISVIISARSADKLQSLKDELGKDVKIIVCDLSAENGAYELYEKTKSENIDILINNAGFGLFGNFSKTDLAREMQMVDLNVKAMHILTKLFLKDFVKKDKGYILNVASSAGLMPGGPLMAAYYATKAYVVSLTNSLAEELRQKGSGVSVSALCPGPVDTNFNNTAGVSFSVKPLSSADVSRYAICKMFSKKQIIIPGVQMKCANFFKRFLTTKFLLKCAYNIQKRKK